MNLLIKDRRLQFHPLICFDHTSITPNFGAFSLLDYLAVLSFFLCYKDYLGEVKSNKHRSNYGGTNCQTSDNQTNHFYYGSWYNYCTSKGAPTENGKGPTIENTGTCDWVADGFVRELFTAHGYGVSWADNFDESDMLASTIGKFIKIAKIPTKKASLGNRLLDV